MALLPVAHLKLTVFGAPLYSVEVPALVALVAYAYGLRKKTFSLVGTASLHNPLVFGSALFFLGAALSFAASPFSLTGLGMLKTWFVFPLIALWLWLQTEPETGDLKRLLYLWLGVVVLVACASLVFFAQGELTYDGRLAAWYASPNYLALFLAPGVFLASYFLIWAHPRQALRQLLLWACLATVSAALFLTRSYETWAALLAALFIFFLTDTAFPSWRKKIAAALVCLGIFSVAVLFESGSGKWQALVMLNERSSLASREMIWQVAAKIISDHPFFGIGIGRFQETYLEYQRYFPPYLEWAVPQPHNLYLAIWLQTGLIGLLGFFLLVTRWFRGMLMLVRDTGTGQSGSMSALLIALLAMYGIVGLVDTPFFKTDLAFIFWLTLAFGGGLLQQKKKRQEALQGLLRNISEAYLVETASDPIGEKERVFCRRKE